MAVFKVSLACGVPNEKGGIVGSIYTGDDVAGIVVKVMSAIGAHLPTLIAHMEEGLPLVFRVESFPAEAGKELN